ncbi:MAG TPA: hypothetical protein VGN83_11805 [Falsiroseomonas sp.]|nr:hypothetical protein [Falsiroseomonas sp.]
MRLQAFGWTAAVWLGLLVLELAAGGVLLWFAGRHGPALLAVAVNLAVSIRFAVTLRPGSLPLITRYARFDEIGLPRECEGYTRALTGVWAGLLGLFALAHAAAMLDIWTVRAVSTVESFVLLSLFLGEHPLRGWLFPQIGRVTLLRTLRAIRLSSGARHVT